MSNTDDLRENDVPDPWTLRQAAILLRNYTRPDMSASEAADMLDRHAGRFENENIRRRVMQRLTADGISADALAEKAHVSRRAMGDLLAGRTKFTAGVLAAIAHALNVPACDLLHASTTGAVAEAVSATNDDNDDRVTRSGWVRCEDPDCPVAADFPDHSHQPGADLGSPSRLSRTETGRSSSQNVLDIPALDRDLPPGGAYKRGYLAGWQRATDAR